MLFNYVEILFALQWLGVGIVEVKVAGHEKSVIANERLW